MFNLLQNASDDQTAIGACILTLAGAAFFVFVSFHLGPAGQKLRNRNKGGLSVNFDGQAPISSSNAQDRAA